MQKLSSIQILRAVAANMVVLSHLAVIEAKYGAGFAILPSLETIGRLGVYLFFIISGFVIAIVASSGTSARGFLWARLTRIYPIYWLYTALVLAVAAVAPSAVNSSVEQTPSLVRSLLLLPDVTLPWLAVGWSLVHEVYFYLVVAGFLVLGINLAAGLIGWSLLLLVLLPITPTGPVATVLLSPMTFLFIGGAALWLGLSRFGAVRGGPPARLLEQLGDASYSVYLSHVLVMSALGRLFAVLPWHSMAAEAAFVLVCLVAVNAWGWISYRLIERPLMALARARHALRPSVVAAG